MKHKMSCQFTLLVALALLPSGGKTLVIAQEPAVGDKLLSPVRLVVDVSRGEGEDLSAHDRVSSLDTSLPEDGVTRIACQYQDKTYHYDLYIPQDYYADPQRRYPVIFIASPVGEAEMGNAEEWIRSRRWIAVMLVESRNGPWQVILENFDCAHDDVVRRVRIDFNMKFATGFSGGARASAYFVSRRAGFRGLILQGAGECASGFNSGSLFVFAAFGSGDYNLPELYYLKSCLPPERLKYEVFDGGHEWAPDETMNRAFAWLDVAIHQVYTLAGGVRDSTGVYTTGVTVTSSTGNFVTTDQNGKYAFTCLFSGTYMLTPTLPGYAFWPVTQTVTLPPDARQDFIILPVGVSTTLNSGVAATLTYTNMQGLRTILAFGANTVDQPTTVSLKPTMATVGSGLAFAEHAFELTFQASAPQIDLTFSAPVTVYIRYSDQDVRVIRDENQLGLYSWTGSGWQDAAETCDPVSSYTRDVSNNAISVPICQPGLFALLGPTYQTHLPLIMRGSSSLGGDIRGRVTYQGAPIAGINLELGVLYNGYRSPTGLATTTYDDGTYRFTGVPSLKDSKERYYVSYSNSSNPNYLRYWRTRGLNYYIPDASVVGGDLDIANIPLVSPTDGAIVVLPHAFHWTRRTTTPLDDYEFDLYDPDPHGIAYWYTDPPLGYVSSYNLNSLPQDFSPGTRYLWEIWVYGPDGSYGVSYETWSVTFSNTGARLSSP